MQDARNAVPQLMVLKGYEPDRTGRPLTEGPDKARRGRPGRDGPGLAGAGPQLAGPGRACSVRASQWGMRTHTHAHAHTPTLRGTKCTASFSLKGLTLEP